MRRSSVPKPKQWKNASSRKRNSLPTTPRRYDNFQENKENRNDDENNKLKSGDTDEIKNVNNNNITENEIENSTNGEKDLSRIDEISEQKSSDNIEVTKSTEQTDSKDASETKKEDDSLESIEEKDEEKSSVSNNDKEVGELEKTGDSDDKGEEEKKGLDVTDNDVDDEKEVKQEEGNPMNLSEQELEEEWKKLTEDPNYPSLMTVANLTPRSSTNQNTQNNDVTGTQSQMTRYSVPPLHIPESVRWTQRQQAPNYTPGQRALTDVPYSSFSYQSKHPSRQQQQYTTRTRRHSIPKPVLSSMEPYHHNNYNSTQQQTQEYNNNFTDDNSLLISARKLDGLLFRLFYKHQFNQTTSTIVPTTNNTSDPNQHNAHVKTQHQTSLPIFENSGSDVISMDPVTWQLRPMAATEKETLQSELSYLEENLVPKEVIQRLFMDGVITHLDYNQLTHTEGQGDRAVVRLLIGTLQRRGEQAFPAFMSALKDLNYIRVHEHLDTVERGLRRGMEDDREDMERRTRMENTYRSDLNNDIFTTTRNSVYPALAVNTTPLGAIPPTPQPPTPQEQQQQPSQPTQTSSDEGQPRFSSREEYNKEVEKQLSDLNAEMKILHEDINSLRTSRSNTNRNSPNPSSDNPQPAPPPKQVPPKSSSCSIL